MGIIGSAFLGYTRVFGAGEDRNPFPLNITGIQEWWNSSEGISLTGNNVDTWTGQVNGTVLTKAAVGEDGLLYNASDSSINNKPTLQNTGEVYAPLINLDVTTFTPTVDRSMFFIIKPDAEQAGATTIGGQTVVQGANNASGVLPLTSDPTGGSVFSISFFNQTSSPSFEYTPTTLTVNNEVYCFIITIPSSTTANLNIMDSSGTVYEQSETGLIDVGDMSPLKLSIGGNYGNDPQDYVGLIMEWGWVNGVMSSGDISGLQQYTLDTYT